MASSPKPAFIRRSAAASVPASVQGAIFRPGADLRCSCPPVRHVRFPGAPRLTYEQLPSAFRPTPCPVYPGSGCGTFGLSGPKAVRSWVTGRRRLTIRSSGPVVRTQQCWDRVALLGAAHRPLNSGVRRQRASSVESFQHAFSFSLRSLLLLRLSSRRRAIDSCVPGSSSSLGSLRTVHAGVVAGFRVLAGAVGFGWVSFV